jgi:hypothetical protein
MMTKSTAGTIGRRDLLAKTVPACAAACLGLGRVPGLKGAVAGLPCQEVHKFDTKIDRQFSVRELMRMEVRAMETIIKAMREDMGDNETIRVLNMSSKALGEQVGKRQAESVSDTTFENFVAGFRQMITGNNLTGEVVEDTEEVFALRITECIWPEVLGEVGLDGEIGHATVCNMDYHWPPAFNPAFKMERSTTLMQGHDCCNHRYINTAAV